jgi:ATP-dependent helicase HrpA
MPEALDDQLPPLTPQRRDAIHRAILSGLLGNIGQKTDAHEYTGARGTKFNLFPGSGLFKTKPQWVMAAEIVETARLYARTVARIQPQWIERLAEHLVQRSYFDPHWQSHTAHVAAYEKVTLYGLVLVPRRTVHYGPIDPKTSRELFIQHALVEGDFRTAGPFFRHNQILIEEVQRLEAKARRRDVLVENQVRFAFYDARIPQGIVSGPTFERWRKSIEQENPRLLFMTRRDLMLHGAEDVTAEQFPDELLVGDMRLPLEYHLEPGEPIDGVTVTLPLAALNQVPAERFDWLVPGMLEEKAVALIRTLPKSLRTSFVPAPQFAQGAVRNLKFAQGNFFDALATELGRMAGVPLTAAAFDIQNLPDPLRMNLRVIDPAGKQLAMGRDLAQLRRQLGQQATSTFATAAPSNPWHRDGLTRWDFGDLPDKIEINRHGMTLAAYPALVDEGSTVSLRLLDSLEVARLSTRAGVRRLFMLQLREEMKYLARTIPGLDTMALQYATLGNGEQLKSALLTLAADRALFDHDPAADIRTYDAFTARAKTGWQRLSAAMGEVATVARESLSLYQEIQQQLSGNVPPAWAPSIADMRQQLTGLMTNDFLTRTPPQWLAHLPRYLKGLLLRLQKLKNAGLTRDLQHAATVAPFQRNYTERRQAHQKRHVFDPALEQFRWMLEELRISLFAQELKTSIPISPQRLEKQWLLVKP